jgi:hypothetical protein
MELIPYQSLHYLGMSSVGTPCSKYSSRAVNLLRRQLQVTQGMRKKSRRRNED